MFIWLHSYLGTQFRTAVYDWNQLAPHLVHAMSEEDWAKARRMQALIATAERRYDYSSTTSGSHENLNELMDVEPTTFWEWLNEEWAWEHGGRSVDLISLGCVSDNVIHWLSCIFEGFSLDGMLVGFAYMMFDEVPWVHDPCNISKELSTTFLCYCWRLVGWFLVTAGKWSISLVWPAICPDMLLFEGEVLLWRLRFLYYIYMVTIF